MKKETKNERRKEKGKKNKNGKTERGIERTLVGKK